jgi:hypothetical protein
MNFKVLLHKTIISIDGLTEGSESVLFTDSDGVQYRMWHSQDCCESVCINDINGDIQDLLNSPITMAEEASNNDNPPVEKCLEGTEDEYEYSPESHTWTFYKLATIKGYLDIRWLGTSNGYYSESVDFAVLD